MKRRVLEYLRGNPVMISFAEGFFDDEWSEEGVDVSLCELPAGLLEQIGRSIPGLKSINLKQCSGIDMLIPSGFLSLCEGCRHIRIVNLVGATTMSDTMLKGMHKLCGSLRVVLLGGCMNLTPAALVDFVRNAGRNLVELDLSGCQVNDFVVKEIVENCSNLVTLSMAYCDDVRCVVLSPIPSLLSPLSFLLSPLSSLLSPLSSHSLHEFPSLHSIPPVREQQPIFSHNKKRKIHSQLNCMCTSNSKQLMVQRLCVPHTHY